MDKEYQEKPNTVITNIKEESSRKLPIGVGGGNSVASSNNNDRSKRDEWSEGAVSSLLEAYESKWVLRNRAKLKGHDWEDVARFVSSRANCTKSPKTQTQCKNKIESMKKRYRSESAMADSSSWPLYQRLDLLLRGSSASQTPLPPPPPPTTPTPIAQRGQAHAPSVLVSINPPLMLLDPAPVAQTPPVAPPPTAAALPAVVGPTLAVGTAQNSHGSDGVDGIAMEDGNNPKLSDHVSDKKGVDSADSSTPALYTENSEKFKSQKQKLKMEGKKKRKRREEWEIADSIRWLAEVVLRSEQSRMDTMRELEKMRIEAEAKRCETDLKRTEMLANTQLEIAKLFASVGNEGVDSSLRIGRN